jgi:putative N6-adenine-specific DNA methylase
MFRSIAHCPLGLEPVCADEIASLGLEVGEVSPNEGIVEFDAALSELFRANLLLRTVERLSVALAEFDVWKFEQLIELTADIAWERWLDDRRRLLLRVTSRGSKLYHERAIAERVHTAIERRLGRTLELAKGEELDDPGRDVQLVIVRLERNHCMIRLDSSGTRLHRRGYREETAGAPLRETLAAAVIRACGWQIDQPFVDPFCGSGTFVIEAAERALALSAGRRRVFAMERWPFADAAEFASIRERETKGTDETGPVIVGLDRAEGAIRAAQGNAKRAGVLHAVRLQQSPVSRLRRPGREAGWVITNPPWGKRLSGGNLDRLFSAFGRVLREEFVGYDLGMLCPEPALLRGMGLDFEEGPWLNNGGQHVQLVYASIE